MEAFSKPDSTSSMPLGLFEKIFKNHKIFRGAKINLNLGNPHALPSLDHFSFIWIEGENKIDPDPGFPIERRDNHPLFRKIYRVFDEHLKRKDRDYAYDFLRHPLRFSGW